VILDSRGTYRGSASGEGQYEILKASIEKLLAEGRAKNTLRKNKIPLRIETPSTTGLLYPGKLAYDSTQKKFWVSDSNHHRVVRFDKNGSVDLIVGSGAQGTLDGAFEVAEFFQPQGIAIDGDQVYVADTSNHLIRKIDLKTHKVETFLGTGRQGYERNPSGTNLKTIPLASPWDLEIFNLRGKKLLAIAMAGTHQIWGVDLKTNTVEVLAGSGREDIDDGAARSASLAQTSGLFAVSEKLYFADSETSSLRVLSDGEVTTLIGAGLFEFGLKDGDAKSARLQHALGLTVEGDHIYIADTYNHAIRDLNLKTHQISTLISEDLKEPNDVLVVDGQLWIADTNHHKIKTYDFKSKELKEIKIKIEAPVLKKEESKRELPFLPNAKELPLQTGGLAKTGDFHIALDLQLPKDHKINEQAPSIAQVYEKNSIGFNLVGSQKIISPKTEISIPLKNKSTNDLVVDLTIYHCPKTESAMSSCTISSLRIPVKLTDKRLKISTSLLF
jgi:DNA-binding beta-propeller fold protein YncE